MKKIRRHLNNLKLAHKFALLSTISLLVLSATGTYLVCYISRLYHKELYAKTSASMASLISDLENQMKEIATATDYLVDDDQIQAALTIYSKSADTGEKARNKQKIYNDLYSYFNTNPCIISIVLVLSDNTLVRMGYSEQDFTSEAFSSLEKQADLAGGRLVWQSGRQYQNAVVCARQIRQKEYLKLDKLAVLIVEINMEQLIHKTMLQADNSLRNTSLILDTGEGIFFYPSPFPLSTEKYDSFDIEKYAILNLGGTKWFVTSGNLPYTQWKYLNFTDYNDLFSRINQTVATAVIILIITTVIVILSEYTIINHIIYHFNLLEKKMKYFESGCLELLPVGYDYSERNDEIGIMHRRFDQTVLNYKKLVHDNYRAQLLLKDATIRNLEQQINPHFLYNVLDSIYLMAESRHAPEIADMTHALANLFHASISETNTVIPLKQELDYVNSYIKIQLIRFQDRIHFTSDCDRECLDILIPKLSIQPLVENAIKHSIEETGDSCDIVLKIHMTEDGTRFSVSNTGSCFEENTVLNFAASENKKQDDSSGHGIGLKNINERLQLIYGTDYCLHFANKNSYAIVSFTIPKTDFSSSAQADPAPQA